VVKRYAYSTLHTGKVMRGADVLPDLHSLRPQSEGILLHTSCCPDISSYWRGAIVRGFPLL
jgi:hypothetical protein